jgi:hypothetical protein
VNNRFGICATQRPTAQVGHFRDRRGRLPEEGGVRQSLGNLADHWTARGCERGRGDVSRATADAEPYLRTPLEAGMISLIEYTSEPDPVDGTYNWEVLFVRWESVLGNPRSARQIRLDDQDRIIYNIPFVVPVSFFRVERTKVIVADLPVVMHKRVARFRSPMPPFALVLHWHASALRSPGPLHGKGRCVLCKLAVELGVACGAVYGDGRDLFVCHSCLCPWHDICTFFAASLGSHGDVDVDLTGFVCPMCSASA